MSYSAVQYLLDDYPRTLFPMATGSFLVENGHDLLYEYIQRDILDAAHSHKFLSQTQCHAAKAQFHLRRTMRLDPVAELFIYDLVYRNRTSFKKDHLERRRSFGYRFYQGRPASPMNSYRAFREAVTDASAQYAYSLRLDVALYFNSVYHHDLVSYFAELGWPEEDYERLGLFLREISAGRSIDCLPQGLNPCKVIGADFLKFVDHCSRLRSELTLRFMDDLYLFADDIDDLTSDLLTIQEVLGEKGLSLNTAKTTFGEGPEGVLEEEIDAIKVSLLQLRQKLIEVSGEEMLVTETEYTALEPKQTEYLLDLLKHPDIDEADAELVLTLLTDHGQEVLEQLGDVLPRFPVLAKTLFAFLGKTDAREGLEEVILGFLADSRVATEYQLFWITCCTEAFLSTSPRYGDILTRLFEHPNATPITQARVLEIPEQRFGMPEWRTEYLRSGESTWRSWSAAVGTRSQTRQSRNHVLSYFANASPMNRVIADIVKRH